MSVMPRQWLHEAIAILEADEMRSADTHLHTLPLPADWNVDLYLKDESGHPTGSLKHRLARSLILYGLVNGRIRAGTTLVEASSGSTAVSEAYFARLLGLPFVAVMPAGTSQEKVALIESYGGRCRFVDEPTLIYDEARRVAIESDGHFLDQFTYAERSTDWRGNNNVAESIFDQLSRERHPIPAWIVLGAGTGGTSATLGRYVRYRRHATRVCVVDPENSALYEGWRRNDVAHTTGRASRIEGIGRPQVEPSFIPGVIDAMLTVPDAASIAAMHWTSDVVGRRVGGSTGTAVWGALTMIAQMRAAGAAGSVVSLICDGGERYSSTYYNQHWLAEQGLDPQPFANVIDDFLSTGEWNP